MTYDFDHLHLRSLDSDAAVRFYEAMFGAREVARMDGRITLALGGITVFIEQAPATINAGAEAPNLGIEHLALRVADLEGALADLKAKGVPVVSPLRVLRPGLLVAFVEGPDAVLIELLQRG